MGKLGPDARLALVRGRRWLEQLDDDGYYDADDEEAEKSDCERRGALLRDHPDYAEAWYEFSFCVEDHGETLALLETALAIDPTNASALRFFALLAEDQWDEYGVPAGQLIRYQRTGYEVAQHEQDKLVFAGRLYRTSLESGRRETAEAVRRWVRRDFGLETHNYTGEGGVANLELVCSFWVVYVLTEACIAAIESVFVAAAEEGVPVPDDVVAVIPGVLSTLDYVSPGASPPLVFDGPPSLPLTESAKARCAIRLKQAMESVGRRSAEFQRVYSLFRDGLFSSSQ